LSRRQAEELLVEEIAVSYWMERRAQLFENGELRQQARDAVIDELWKEVEDDAISDRLEEPFVDRKAILTRSQGLECVLGIVAQIRDEVDTNTQISADLSEKLSKICGGDWESVREKSEMLAQLDWKKERLERLKKKVDQLEAGDWAAELQSAQLLAPNKLEVLLRYTAANGRRRHRAMALLERLRRQRNGEAVPPPIDVQVTGDAGDFAKRSNKCCIFKGNTLV
jgi:hypothetical protein